MSAPHVDHDFVIKDAEGVPHRYEMTGHPPIQGQAIMWQLLALGAEPLGRLADLALTSDELLGQVRAALAAPAPADAEAAESTTLSDLAAVAKTLDLARLGRDVKSAILSADMPKLTRDVLQFTTRDGASLASDIHFAAAYKRNYGELLQAVWQVVQANRFLPLPGTF